MSLLTRLMGADRSFFSQGELRQLLEDTFDKKPDENFVTSEMLLLFEGAKQHTWLCATAQALYCIFDVVTEPEPRVKWRIPKEHIVNDNRVTLNITASDASKNSGLITINRKHPRKFTKKLFPDRKRDVTYYVRIMLYKVFEIPVANWN